MREIKFRARRIDNGRWVYGQYFKTPLTDENSGTTPDVGWFFLSGESRHCIVQDSVSFVVDVKTLGQFTGLKDKNSKEIYESDVVKNEYGRICEVIWNECNGCWDLTAINSEGHVNRYFSWEHWEVVGNIYERPELIKAN